MSDTERDTVLGKAMRECSELERSLAALASELKAIGENLIIAGRVLKENPAVFCEDREVMTSDVARIWELVDKYKDASVRLTDKRAELARLTG